MCGAVDEALLRAISQRVLWLSTVIVDAANRGRPNSSGVVAAGRGAVVVRAVTSPANRGSIAFHQRMGFQLEPGDAQIGGIPVSSGHDGPDGDRVPFIRRLPGA